MRTLLTLLAVAVLASPLVAQPTITSVSPSQVPTTGGTTVTIKGTGFESCPICSPALPPEILIGGVYLNSTIVDQQTLTFVTPAFLPATVSVSVLQWNGNATLPNSLTFVGEPGLVPVLFPIASAPLEGAHGSQFVTEITAANRSQVPISIFGVDTTCYLTSPVLDPSTHPDIVTAGVGHSKTITLDCSQWPARILWIPPSQLEQVSFNIRVHDTSRNALSHGTEIPVVREDDMTEGPLVFAGVPRDETRFRKTLRIYAMATGPVNVTVRVGGVERQVVLIPGETIFEPAYAQLSDLPIPGDEESSTIVVFPDSGPIGPAPVVPIWGLLTLTNNETQEITTITPDV